MKATEFRIGNLVQGAKGVARITQLSNDSIDSYKIMAWYIVQPAYGNSEEHLEPILLTEEWLELLGFGLKKEGDDVFENIWQKDQFRLWQHHEGFCLELKDDAPLDYVHQLQNIYYALTGDELYLNS